MKSCVHFLVLFILIVVVSAAPSPHCTYGKCLGCGDDGSCRACSGGMMPKDDIDGYSSCVDGEIKDGCLVT